MKTTLSRAQSLILLNAIVQEIITFQTAPAILRLDDGRRKQSGGPGTLRPGPGQILPIVQDAERVGLLGDEEENEDSDGDDGRDDLHGVDGRVALKPVEDMPDYRWPRSVKFAQKPLQNIRGYMSPPLIGAIIALIIGVRVIHYMLEPFFFVVWSFFLAVCAFFFSICAPSMRILAD